jgi:hypothetical protein
MLTLVALYDGYSLQPKDAGANKRSRAVTCRKRSVCKIFVSNNYPQILIVFFFVIPLLYILVYEKHLQAKFTYKAIGTGLL